MGQVIASERGRLQAGPGRWGCRTALGGLRAIAGLVVVLLAWGCDKDLSRQYELIVLVSSEPGRGLEGAEAALRGSPLGVSDGSGRIDIRVRGREGDVLPISVRCPPGHRPPAVVLVPLRQVRDGVRPEFSAVCTPTTHSVVVAVRAEKGPNLPLLHLGRELARTDASGAAHLVLDVASQDIVELVLDTTQQPRLRPRSPILRIAPGPADEITAIHQELSVQPREVVKKVVARRGPVRLE